MVMRASGGQLGGPNDIYDLWTSRRTANENNEDARTIDKRFRGHYKSHIANFWTSLEPSQVSQIQALLCSVSPIHVNKHKSNK